MPRGAAPQIATAIHSTSERRQPVLAMRAVGRCMPSDVAKKKDSTAGEALARANAGAAGTAAGAINQMCSGHALTLTLSANGARRRTARTGRCKGGHSCRSRRGAARRSSRPSESAFAIAPWAHPRHICTGDCAHPWPSLPHLQRDWARPRHMHRDCAHAHCCQFCIGTRLACRPHLHQDRTHQVYRRLRAAADRHGLAPCVPEANRASPPGFCKVLAPVLTHTGKGLQASAKDCAYCTVSPSAATSAMT
jgi:hypothetical protein